MFSDFKCCLDTVRFGSFLDGLKLPTLTASRNRCTESLQANVERLKCLGSVPLLFFVERGEGMMQQKGFYWKTFIHGESRLLASANTDAIRDWKNVRVCCRIGSPPGFVGRHLHLIGQYQSNVKYVYW